MTERENMQLVWEHKQPEWVPMINVASQMLISPEINDRPLFENGKDWFGLEWEMGENRNLMTHVKPYQQLVTDISSWREQMSFPSCRDLPWEQMAGRTRAMWKDPEGTMGYVVLNMGGFERINAMMGFEDGLCALYDDEEAYLDYVNAYADYRIEQLEYLKKYFNPDFVMAHDDWGNQQNLFLSPELWRKFYKEPERRLAKACHDLGMYYMHHSCGYIQPIVGDLVEIGVDSWHSVSPVNDLAAIKAQYGDKLVFAGGVDPQVTDAPGATEEDIRAEVRRAIDVLGQGGGYLCSSAVMFSVVPGVDDIITDEGIKYGRYHR